MRAPAFAFQAFNAIAFATNHVRKLLESNERNRARAFEEFSKNIPLKKMTRIEKKQVKQTKFVVASKPIVQDDNTDILLLMAAL